MPYDGTYTLHSFTKRLNSSPAEYPIAVFPRPSGEQGFYNFHEHDSMELAIITEGRVQVTVSEDKAYEVFDTKRFAEEHTRLYKQYLKEPKIKKGAINVTLKEEK